MNRRGFIGALCGLLALPLAKLRAREKPRKKWVVTKVDREAKVVTYGTVTVNMKAYNDNRFLMTRCTFENSSQDGIQI